VDTVEFIRAGAALQYGPQPGGAIHFVTRMPRRDAPFHFTTKNVGGSDEYYRNYTAIDGTVGYLGYVGPDRSEHGGHGDLREGDALQYEAGWRGKPLPYLTFDLGGFYFTFEDQVGDIIVPAYRRNYYGGVELFF
jgi:hypothetical protein